MSDYDDAVTRIRAYAKPNSANARKLLETLDTETLDGVEDALDALAEYSGLDRGDYDDGEEYGDARRDTWEEFLDALDGIEPIKEEDGEEEETGE